MTIALTAACGSSEPDTPINEESKSPSTGTEVGEITRVDPRFNALIPAEAKIEKLAGGFVFIEGPVGTATNPNCYSQMYEATRCLRWAALLHRPPLRT